MIGLKVAFTTFVVLFCGLGIYCAFKAGRKPVRKLGIGTYYFTLARTRKGDARVPGGIRVILKEYVPEKAGGGEPFLAELENDPPDDFWVSVVPAQPSKIILIGREK
jgi:hypothetical protein